MTRTCFAVLVAFAWLTTSYSQAENRLTPTSSRTQPAQENRLDKVEIGPTKSEREKQLEAWGLIGRPDRSEQTFPLMLDLIPRDRVFPLPFGVNVMSNWLQSSWDLKSATIGIVGDIEVGVPAHRVDIDLEALGTGMKVDMWIFPFFNIFAAAGRTSAKVDLVLKDVRTQIIPPVYEDIRLNLDFSGPYTTLGMVFAGGYGPFFGSVDFAWVHTQMASDETSMDLSGDGFVTMTAAPRIGLAYDYSQFWFGFRYISKEEHFKGTVPREAGNDLFFDVKLDVESVHYTFGLRTTLWDRWEALAEFGFGPKKAWNFAFGYRF